MSRFRKTRPAPRTPHPDARTETQLQALAALRATAARAENLADTYLEEIRSAHKELDKAAIFIRNNSYNGSAQVYDQLNQAAIARSAAAQQQLTTTEQEIAQLHEEIARRTAAMDPNDLAWL